MPNKTIEDLLRERDQVLAASKLPGIPTDERLIYTQTIMAIDKAIEAKKASARATTKPPSAPNAIPTPAPPIVAAEQGYSNAHGYTPPRRQAQRPEPEDAECVPIVQADISTGMKRVKIEWGHGKADILTEGEARSRFTTALRDLAESRMARMERWDDVERYVSFQRAVAYYEALTEFWEAQPSAGQLGIAPLGKVRTEIFSRIQTQAA